MFWPLGLLFKNKENDAFFFSFFPPQSECLCPVKTQTLLYCFVQSTKLLPPVALCTVSTLGRVLHDCVLWMRTARVSTLKWVLHDWVILEMGISWVSDLCPAGVDCLCIYFGIGIAWMTIMSYPVACVLWMWTVRVSTLGSVLHEWVIRLCPVGVDCLCTYYGIGIAWISDPVVSCGCGLPVHLPEEGCCMDEWSAWPVDVDFLWMWLMAWLLRLGGTECRHGLTAVVMTCFSFLLFSSENIIVQHLARFVSKYILYTNFQHSF